MLEKLLQKYEFFKYQKNLNALEEYIVNESYDWLYNDLYRLLFRTRFNKYCFNELTQDEKNQVNLIYLIFQKYDRLGSFDELSNNEKKDYLHP